VRRSAWSWLAISLLALAASATSLANGFAFDDLPIIARDTRIHTLDAPWRFFAQPYWGPPARPALYRPLTSLVFALQWRLGGGAPWPFHAVNVCLYLLVALAVYRLARRVLSPGPAWWAAAFFAVHPVHVEAVGNAVGQSELWAALLVALATIRYLALRRRGRIGGRDILYVAALYLAACCFKEHAIVLPAMLVAAELVVEPGSVGHFWRRPDLYRLYAALSLTGAGFWAVHALVIGQVAGDYPNPAFHGAGAADRFLTMLAVVPRWCVLLLAPVHLQVDYMPGEIPRAHELGALQVVGLGLLLAAAAVMIRCRHHGAPAFGIAWTGIALLPVSNVLVPSGVLLAERTLFLPSVGAMLVLGSVIEAAGTRRWSAARGPAAIVGAALLVAGAWRSAVRQGVWRDPRSFENQLLIDAPRSYRAHWLRGVRLLRDRDVAGADAAFDTAVTLFPDDPALLVQVADRYRASGRCGEAVPLYRRSLALDARNPALRRRVAECLVLLGRGAEARAEIQAAVSARAPGGRRDARWLDSLLGNSPADSAR
jgi:hypothetical protein